MIVTTHVKVFWVVTECSDVVGYQHLTLKMQAAQSSELLLSYNTTWHHNPHDLSYNHHFSTSFFLISVS